MRRQHQGVLRQVGERRERIEESPQRIAVGIDGADADVGRNPRQQHVAGDQHAALGAVERRVLRRVAVPDDDPPGRVARLPEIAAQTSDRTNAAGRARRGGRRCRASRSAASTASACRAGERGSIVASSEYPPNSPAPHARSGTRRGSWRPARRIAREPRCIADVIGMIVRCDDVPDRHRTRASSRCGAPTAVRVARSPKPQSTSVHRRPIRGAARD